LFFIVGIPQSSGAGKRILACSKRAAGDGFPIVIGIDRIRIAWIVKVSLFVAGHLEGFENIAIGIGDRIDVIQFFALQVRAKGVFRANPAAEIARIFPERLFVGEAQGVIDIKIGAARFRTIGMDIAGSHGLEIPAAMAAKFIDPSVLLSQITIQIGQG
jgi:hypothetical protein